MTEGDYKERLKEAQKAPVAAFQMFVTSSERAGCVFLFCEGEEDILFYVPIVGLAGFSEVFPVDCGNKAGVLSVHRMITEKTTARSDFLCFCDLDFDAVLLRRSVAGERLFVTDGYSIENYFELEEVFRIFLVAISGVVWDRDLLDGLIKRLKLKYAQFVRVHLVISAYAIAAIRAGNENPLSDISFDYILRIRNGRVRFNSDNANHLKQVFRLRHGDLRAEIQSLKRFDAKYFVRGKYHIRMIWMLLRHAYTIVLQRYPTSPISGRAIKIPGSAHGREFFSMLATRIDPPKDLVEFLKLYPPR